MSARLLRQPERLNLRCTTSQSVAWRAAARQAGLDLSAWARQQLDGAADSGPTCEICGTRAPADRVRRSPFDARMLCLYCYSARPAP